MDLEPTLDVGVSVEVVSEYHNAKIHILLVVYMFFKLLSLELTFKIEILHLFNMLSKPK